MTSSFISFCNFYGNIASVLGLIISVLGFWFAIRGITTAKKAAQQAEKAAVQMKEKILKYGTLANFSSTVTLMEEIIRLQRKKDWENVLDRHSELRRMLTELKDGSLTGDQQTIVQGVILQFISIEKSIEKHVSEGKSEPKSSNLNEIVKNQMAKMQEISIALKNN